MLIHMNHENVIGLIDMFSPNSNIDNVRYWSVVQCTWDYFDLLCIYASNRAVFIFQFEDLYLATHLMGADLNNIVKTQRLSDDHVQFLIYQILRGISWAIPMNQDTT